MQMRRQKANQPQQEGISLIETAIVLTVASFLLMLAVSASHILRNARIYRLFTEMKAIEEASSLYQQRYQSYPGDTSNATTLFGCIDCNGDGDGMPDPLLFWWHLSLAGMVKGTHDGTDAPRIGYPESHAFPGYYFKIIPGGTFNRVVLVLTTSTASADGPLTPKEASQLDRAYDDGKVNVGWIGAIDPDSAPASCRDGTGFLYNIDYTGQVCSPTYILEGEPYFEHRWYAGAWSGCSESPAWVEDAWGACSEACNGGTQTRTVTCDNTIHGTQTRIKACIDGITLTPVADENCAGYPEPTTSQACLGRCPAPNPTTIQACNTDPC
jgi:type II secretory pathway pseudopilin PulG